MQKKLLVIVAALALLGGAQESVPVQAQSTAPPVQVLITEADGSVSTLTCTLGYVPTPLQQLQTGGREVSLTMSSWTGPITDGQTLQMFSCS